MFSSQIRLFIEIEFLAGPSRQNGVGGKVLRHYKPNGLRQTLNKVATDTGLALTVRGASWNTPDQGNWRRRYGISLQPLIRPA